MAKKLDRKLILKTGEVFAGSGFGGGSPQVCELTFNTSMITYQEAVCDPANTGTLLMMSYPIIGITGVAKDMEKSLPRIGGLVVREYNDQPSNFRSGCTLSQFLERHDIPGIEGVDTRAITRLLRDKGAVQAVIVSADCSDEQAARLFEGCKETNLIAVAGSGEGRSYGPPESARRVVMIDCGAKEDIAVSFAQRGCYVTTVRWDADARDIDALNPSGVIVAGGPGNPGLADKTIETVRKLAGRYPILGVNAGFCIAALACGAKIEKLRAGHRGGNRPMRWLETGAVRMSDRNFGYRITEDSLTSAGFEISCLDIIDGTVMAAFNEEKKIYGTLHYPELRTDTQDSDLLAALYIESLREGRKNA